jgi:rhamnose transport system substrate-binding protein
MNAGIKVYSLDSGVNPASRMTHVNQADTQAIGETLVEAAFDLAGGSGEIAILSATSTASNQNAWIAVMEQTLRQPKYSGLNLVRIAYGDDLRDKSTSETQGLLASFPNLKVIIAPTTVGIAAAGKVVTDQGLIGRIKVTGLGLPSEMADYITNGACPYMFLWNPIDVGYLGAYVASGLSSGRITGAAGESFTAGRLGRYTITRASDGGTEVLLGPPFKFDRANINDWKSVY